ncbi:LPS export ABC transporter permease LptF [Ectothiorhodospira mobilis]|uniref:LPS export ABC transporter permease LptF n=1 Tax=Ectothiorhodospira mobilis TaxID=195064 RepID=UPI000B8331FB|nr:LPS export ABC transporter permease LptF [Ectothiorhodospira mobilis]
MTLKVLDRYLMREMLATQGAVILVLVLIILGGMLARLLQEVTEGRIPADVLPPILLLGTLNALILLLPVSLFLAVMLTLGRLYKDSEMAALMACGVGYGGLYRPVLLVSLPLAGILLALSLTVGPWSKLQVDEIRAESAQRSDLVGVTPGRFLETGIGGTVFFVESFSEDREVMHNVFIQRRQEGETQVMVARSARQEVDAVSGQRFLVLKDGMRYDGSPGDRDFRIIRFATHGVRMPDPGAARVRNRTDNVPTARLWGSERVDYRAELQWRLSVPVSLLLLALLAPPLAHTAPRKGRFARLALGVGVYVVYAQMQILAKEWFADGQLPAWLGMWWVHLALALLAVLLLMQRQGVFRPRGRTRREAVA